MQRELASGRRKSLRVLHVTTTGQIGGAERLIVDLVRTACLEGHYEPAICVLHSPQGMRRELAGTEVPVHSLDVTGPRTLLRGVVQLRNLMVIGRFDVVHTHLLHASTVGLVMARLLRVRLSVMTRHYERYVWLYGGRFERVLDRVNDRLADHIFAISAAARDVLRDYEKVDDRRITIVPNGIDFERVRRLMTPTPLADLGDRPGVIIATVGSLHPRKGHAQLVRAFAELTKREPARLIIVGEGPLAGELAQLAEDLGVADRVWFTGYLADPYGLLREVDIYVQPSIEEGFGIAVLEAMALGRPVIASKAGGLPELIEDGQTGLLVEPDDIAELGAALARLAADPDLRQALAANALRMAERRYDARMTSRSYLSEYVRLLDAPQLS